MKLLITAGATREPIDSVRYLSNVSTGTTGAALADVFIAAGHTVLLLRGANAVSPTSDCLQETFSSAADLLLRLRHHLTHGGFDAVIMAAAVADYRPAEQVQGKISSEPENLMLRLVRNEKILPQLKTFAANPICVVGFKLTAGADEQTQRAAVAAQFAAGGADLVVQNDLAEIRAAAPVDHPFHLYRSVTTEPQIIRGAAALGRALEQSIGAAQARRV